MIDLLHNFRSSEYELAIDYIRHDAPWLLPDLNSAEFYLYSGDYAEEEKIQTIQMIHNIQREMELQRPHVKGEHANPYSFYSDTHKEHSNISKQDFLKLYKAATSIRISPQSLSCNEKIVQSIENLRNANESDDMIRDFLYRVSLYNGKNRDFYDLIPFNNTGNSFDQPNRFLDYSTALKQISGKPDSLREALCYLSLDPFSNDIELETKVVLPLVFSKHRESGNDILLIVEPSVLTFRFWQKNSPKDCHVIFAFRNDATAHFLKNLYPNLYAQAKADIICTNELEGYLVKSISKKISFFLFGNNISSMEEKIRTVDLIKKYHPTGNSLFIFNGDFELEAAESGLHRAFQGMTPDAVWLFPSGITGSTKPERKMLLHFNFGSLSRNTESDSIHIIKFYQSKQDSKNYFLSIKPFILTIDAKQFWSGSTSIRTQYREAERSDLMKSDIKRARHEFVFSDNIVIHYTISASSRGDGGKRVKAYIKTPGPNSVLIKETERRVGNISDDEIENWLTGIYPFLGAKSDPKSTVQRVLAHHKNQFMTRDISLKSFIFLNPSIAELLPNYSSIILKILMNTHLGEYPVRSIDEQRLRSFLNDFLNYYPNYSPRQIILLFREIFKVAKSWNLISDNPAEAIKDFDIEGGENLSDVKAAFSRKFLYENEFKRVISEAKSMIQGGNKIYIAVVIKLYTGLESNIISGLTWSDFVENEEYPGLYQLIIRRQCETMTGAIRRFTNRRSYRIIPCPTALSDILLAEKRRILNSLPAAEQDSIGNQAILTGDTNVRENMYVVRPCELNKLFRKILKSLNIHVETLQYQTDKNTTVEIETDFYGRDIMRESYRHFAIKYGDFVSAEVSYLMGKEQSDTFTNHYMDFSNSAVQKQLFDKQEKIWEEIYNEDEGL